MKKTLESLLHNINHINTKYREIDKISGNRFNIFSILKMETKEVKLHSAFIAELLDPLGIHDMGTIFLDLFISQLRSSDILKSLNFLPSLKTSVRIELHVGKKTFDEGGRIDIILVDEKNHYLIIENKIYATDQENQLIRYNNLATQEKTILYLTLFGDEPSIESVGEALKKDIDYHCVSYRELIKNWLEESYQIAISHPTLRETILQYLNSIKKITGISMLNLEEQKSIYAEVGNSPENALAAVELIRNWIHIKWHTEWDFWEELFLALNKLLPTLLFIKDYDASRLNGAIHVKKNKNSNYGLYSVINQIEKEDKNYEIRFSIIRGFGNINYGIKILERNRLDNVEKYHNYRLKEVSNTYFEECKTNLDDNLWAYKKEVLTSVNFNSFEEEETIKLINSTYRKQAINKLVDEFENFIVKFRQDEILIAEK